MGLFRISAEEQAQNEAWEKEQEEKRIARQAAREAQEFRDSPVGQAREAYTRGDIVFQTSIDVMNQQAIIIAMVGGSTAQRSEDPSSVLNAVCHEGWELLSGSFTFVEQGQESRDKFLSSGQNVSVKGKTVGYYLFKREPSLREAP